MEFQSLYFTEFHQLSMRVPLLIQYMRFMLQYLLAFLINLWEGSNNLVKNGTTVFISIVFGCQYLNTRKNMAPRQTIKFHEQILLVLMQTRELL